MELKMSIMKLFKRKKCVNIVFKTDPHKKGYATLVNKEQAHYIYKLGYGPTVNSLGFETIQKKSNPEEFKFYWIN